ncbi:MAG: AI-2E family transporter [Eggerthellaceae bacterium]
MQSDSEKQPDKLAVRSLQWRLALYVVWTLIGVSILVYFSGNMLGVLSIPVGIIVWTTILVFTLRGAVEKLCDRNISRAVAVSLAFVLLFVVIALVVLLVKPLVAGGGGLDDFMSDVSSSVAVVQTYVEKLYSDYPQIFSDPTVMAWIESSLGSVVAYAEKAVSGLAQNMVSFAGFTMNSLMCIMFSLVASFWLLLEMPRMHGELQRLFGEKFSEDLGFLGTTFSRVLGGFIKGMAVQCAVIGVGCGLAYTLIGFPNAPIYAIIVAACNILPVLGQWVGVAVIAFVCLFTDTMTAILMIVATLVIQRIVYMLIYPKIMADSVDVHPVLVIISMMVGYALGGTLSGLVGSLVGILVSIPLAAVAKAMFVYYFEKKTGRHLVAEDGVFFKGIPNDGDVPDPHHNATSPHPAVYAKRQPSFECMARLRDRVAACAASRASDAEERDDAACPDEPANPRCGKDDSAKDPEKIR